MPVPGIARCCNTFPFRRIYGGHQCAVKVRVILTSRASGCVHPLEQVVIVESLFNEVEGTVLQSLHRHGDVPMAARTAMCRVRKRPAKS
jgi:hypothetical protein